MERVAGKVILLWGWRRALAAFLAGALAVLSQAPFDFFAVCFVSFPVLVWLIDGSTGDPARSALGRLRPAFAAGWWFGFGYFVAGLWWIGNALLVEAESFAWALPLAVLALPAALALFYGLAAAIARACWTGSLTRIAALAAGFGIAEWLRAVAFTGFPWNALGYAAMPVPLLMQSASVVGLYGMNAFAVLVFATPALLAAKRGQKAGFALAGLLVALHVGFGLARLEAGAAEEKTLAVRLVQPSIAQSAKWDAAERDRIFKTYLDLTAAPPAEGKALPKLVIWPETAVPFLLTDRPDALTAIGEVLGEGQTLLAGAVRAEGQGPQTRYTNSVVAIDDRGEIVDAADKVHLVPFGEYLPFEDLLEGFGLTKIVATPISFSPGRGRRLIEAGGVTILPLICYEIIFPGEIGRDAARADLIVSVTNDAWYGDTPGPYQHFRQAQARAAELGRPVARAGNNGISGAIDAQGRILDGFALDAVGALDVEMPLGRPALTFPGDPARTGELILLALAALVLAANLRQWLRFN